MKTTVLHVKIYFFISSFTDFPYLYVLEKGTFFWPDRTLSLQLSQRGSWATTLLDTFWEGRWVRVKPNQCWWECRPEMAELSELSVDHMFTENVEVQGLQLSSFKVLWKNLSHCYWWNIYWYKLSERYVHISGPSDPFLSSEKNPKFCRPPVYTIRYIKKTVSRKVKKTTTKNK